VYLDGKEVAHNYDSMESHTVPVELVAGKEYDFAFETRTRCSARSVPRCSGRLRRFSLVRRSRPSQDRRHGPFICGWNQWIDFWTGEVLAGGKSVVADAPIDKIPLMVRSGSIIPMGPFVHTPRKSRPTPLSYGSIPEPTAASRCMRTKTITITTKRRLFDD